MIKEFQKEYRWLSNFAPIEINLDNFMYPSVEHAYQSKKCISLYWKDTCSDTTNSAEYIKKESRKQIIVDNWDEIKVEIMKVCLEQKFNDPTYKKLLLNTGDLYIQEGNYWGDKFWGICLKTNTGQNILGHLIMNIRTSLAEKG